MTVTKNQLLQLRDNFQPHQIKYRVGTASKDKSRALALAYIDARAVQERLDSVLGPENWRASYVVQPYTIYKKDYKTGETKQFESHSWICTLEVNVEEAGWIGKQDAAEQTQLEEVKGGISDSFKRAAVAWGIGRSLYNLPSLWVAAERRGYATYLAETPHLPQWYKDNHMDDPNHQGGPTTQQPQPHVQAPADPVREKRIEQSQAVPAPAGFPHNLPAQQTVSFGKKVMGNGRPIRDYTWGEIAMLDGDDDAVGYIKWMAKMGREEMKEGKQIKPALQHAITMVDYMTNATAKDALQAVAAATNDNPFAGNDEYNETDAPF